MIVKMLTVGPFMSNCYIVGSDAGQGMVIDPGADSDTILETAQELGLNIELVVVTHSHIDHVGAVKHVCEKTGVPFAMHEAEKLGGMMERLSRVFGGVMGLSFEKPPPPDRLLKDGDIIELGDLRFEVRHIPGHSPGGIVLYRDGVVFSGDALFQYSIGRTDFPGSSHKQLMDGIFDKLMVLPDETIVYPGHGPETTIGAERNGNPFVKEWMSRFH